MPLTIREEADLSDDTTVVRGGMMLARDLAMAAARCEAQFGYPGISVFASVNLGMRELVLASPPLRPYAVVRRTTVGELRRLGCDLVPTGAAPHYTLRLPGADYPTLARVRQAFGPPIPNPTAQ